MQLHRNNQFYDFLLKICELIYRNLLVTEKPGTSKFMDFVQDKRQIAILFENFVPTFYRVHTDFRVKREDIYWRLLNDCGNRFGNLCTHEFQSFNGTRPNALEKDQGTKPSLNVFMKAMIAMPSWGFKPRFPISVVLMFCATSGGGQQSTPGVPPSSQTGKVSLVL